MSEMKLSRHLTETELLDNVISATDRNLIAGIDGQEYICRYLAKAADKRLGYNIVHRNDAMVLCYELADGSSFDRAYALPLAHNNDHPNLKLLYLHS